MKYNLTKSNIHSLFVAKGLISPTCSIRCISIKKLPYCKTWKVEVPHFDGCYEMTVVNGYNDIALFACTFGGCGWCSKFVSRVTIDELKKFGIVNI